MRATGFTRVMRWLSFAAVALCLVLYGWTVWYDRSLERADPLGHRNLKVCAKIPPGATEADLAAALGPPETRVAGGGVLRLTFHTLSVATAPIRAEVDAATGRVLELRCRDDGPPTWSRRR